MTNSLVIIIDTLYAAYLVRRVLFVPPPVPAHQPPALGNSRTGLGTESWNRKMSYEAGTGIASPFNIPVEVPRQTLSQ